METQELTPHQRIIRRFGGMTALARALGHKHPTTVQRWWESGRIPAQHQEEVLKLGQDLDPPIAPQDFFRARVEAA